MKYVIFESIHQFKYLCLVKKWDAPQPTNLSPDFREFSNTSETQIQQELYNQQERPVSSVYTRLCNLRDKLNSKQATLKSQLRQVLDI